MRRPRAALRVGISIVLLAGQLSAQTLDPPPAQSQPAAEQARIAELERRILQLEQRLRELEAALPKPAAPAPTAAATPAPREAPAPQPAVRSLGPPAASDEASAASRTGPISGYMDFHLNKPEHEDPVLDFHRFVLLFSHRFSDRLRFVERRDEIVPSPGALP